MVHDYLPEEDVITAHNALNDVLMLQKLVQMLCNNNTCIINHARSVNTIINTKKNNEEVKERKKSLTDLTISNNMKCKLSKAGINKLTLLKACENGGLDGLTILLSENIGNKPRVTNNKKIITSIFEQLSNVNM